MWATWCSVLSSSVGAHLHALPHGSRLFRVSQQGLDVVAGPCTRGDSNSTESQTGVEQKASMRLPSVEWTSCSWGVAQSAGLGAFVWHECSIDLHILHRPTQ